MRRHALDLGSPAPGAAQAASSLPGKRTLTEQLSAASTGVADDGHEVPHRAAMEAAFGTSFGHVEAHTGPSARAACDEIGASAYALGSHVAFDDPSPDRALVAHELTHVIQQGAGAAGPAPQAKGDGGDAAHEAEADAIAHEVAAGESVAGRIGSLRGAAPGSVQRQPKGARPAAHSPAFADARAKLVETRYLVEATWNDVEHAPDGDVVGARVAQTLGAARATVEALQPQLAALSEAERHDLAPIANALQVAAGKLVAKHKEAKPAWNALFAVLHGAFGGAMLQAGVGAAPGRTERATIARHALDQAKVLLRSDIERRSPDGLSSDAVFPYLAMVPAALSDGIDKGLQTSVVELAALVTELARPMHGRTTPRLRELRAHLGDVQEAVGLDRGNAEGMDVVIKAEQEGSEPSAQQRTDYQARLKDLEIAIDQLFNERQIAVSFVEQLTHLADPVRPPPLWERLAIMALEMATGALVQKALAVLGNVVTVTKTAVPTPGPTAPPPRPGDIAIDKAQFLPGGRFYDPSLNTVVRDWIGKQITANAAAGGGAAKGAEAQALQPDVPHPADVAQPTPNEGEHPSASDVKPAFFKHQANALEHARAEKKHGNVELEAKTDHYLRRDPENTIAILEKLVAAANAAVAPSQETQIQSTTAGYTQLVAASSHGTVGQNIDKKYAEAEGFMKGFGLEGHLSKDAADAKEDRKGTDLRDDVALKPNAMNLLDAHFRKDGAGVLSIDLGHSSPGEPVRIAKAWIAGLNVPLRDQLTKMPLSQMNLPIRVHVRLGEVGHLSFARNPQGEIFASADGIGAQRWCLAKLLAHGISGQGDVVQRAAQIVIEQELGPRVIPKIEGEA